MMFFKSQFKMTKEKQRGMQCFALFSVTFYVQNWFEAPILPKALRTDINYLQKPQNYNDKDISAVAPKAYCCHLWYHMMSWCPLHSLMMELVLI